MEMESTKFESSVLLHPSNAGAAKRSSWSKRLVSSEASVVSDFSHWSPPSMAEAMPTAGALWCFLLDG